MAVSASSDTATSVCRVLVEDSDLAEAIDPALRAEALETVVARQFQIPTGVRRASPMGLENGLGILVMEGVLIHRIGVEQRFGVELIGEGDLLRASAGDDESTFPLTNDWLALKPTRMAYLDERFIRQLAQFPQLAGRLVSRAVLRSRQLAVNMAIVHQARVDVRLHMLFWHLAGRWGRVRSDGIFIPLRLTHAVLSDLVAARRPTVTSALSDLGRRGVVRAIADGWLLSGEPPRLHDTAVESDSAS
jgi:CRP/FNR family transcriptional regulator, cyclic AMP receptor protein